MGFTRRKIPKQKEFDDLYLYFSEREPKNKFTEFTANVSDWEEYRDRVLVDWAISNPGTRPFAWWEHDAPRQPEGNYLGCYYDGKILEPRERLGGIGTPSHEVLSYAPSFPYGIPVSWVSPFDVEYYNGRRKDMHGKLIKNEFNDGDFSGVAIDPGDPPVYESQAAYLKRYGLFMPGEMKKLTADDFEPVTIKEG